MSGWCNFHGCPDEACGGPCYEEIPVNRDSQLRRLEQANKTKDKRIAELEAALEYYAEAMPRHTYYIVEAKDRSFLSDMADWGDRARKALKREAAE